MKPWTDPEATNEVATFYAGLTDQQSIAFDAAVERLAEYGPTLGRPTVGEVDLRREDPEARDLFGKHLKELRAGTIRILFTFGPDRVPVLLYAGDKAGEWSDWYPAAIKEAARLYRAYLEEISP